MCGFFAFSLNMSAAEIAAELDLTNLPKSLADIQSLKFYPKAQIPTVSKNSPNALIKRFWSLIPPWYKDDPEKLTFSTFNARAEEIETKPTYRHAWQAAQRCLIPATWFYEFAAEKEGKKTVKIPYRVEDDGSEIITLAGLYENSTYREQLFSSVTIITCAAVAPISKIHPRQPVTISQQNREKWLNKETPLAEIKNLLKPNYELQMFPIDRKFNKSFGTAVTKRMVESSNLI